jgi:ADP-ribosyl-[dinitrogen reductase] hydrolase
LWEPDLLERRISAEPGARGFLLVLPCPAGPLPAHAAQLAQAGVAALVTLVPRAEAVALALDLAALERACSERGIRWAHAPLVDLGVPDDDFEQVWKGLGTELRDLLGEARGVALHCRAGLGRSGTVAARLLIELGLDPADAVARVRAARPGAIETAAQEHHLLRSVRRGGG